MAIFRRRPGPAADGLPIGSFWQWWASVGRDRVTTALDEGQPLRIVAALRERVAAIDPGLDWETGAGDTARHELTLSASGNPLLRRITERWLRAAPAPDATWQFSAARRAARGFTGGLEIGGVSIGFEDATVTLPAEPDGTRIDVIVHHPALGRLPENQRGMAVFLMLDALLGEDAVERWIGAVEWRADNLGRDPMTALGDAVHRLTARRPGEPEWTLARGTSPARGDIYVRTQRWLRWIDRPLLDLHSRLILTYEARADGLPDGPQHDALTAAEDHLVRRIGDVAELVTIRTGNGRRDFDVYSDSEDQDSTELLRTIAAELDAVIEHSLDPTWRKARVLD